MRIGERIGLAAGAERAATFSDAIESVRGKDAQEVWNAATGYDEGVMLLCAG